MADIGIWPNRNNPLTSTQQAGLTNSYSGYMAAIHGDNWMVSVDPLQDVIAKNRAREAAIAAQQRAMFLPHGAAPALDVTVPQSPAVLGQEQSGVPSTVPNVATPGPTVTPDVVTDPYGSALPPSAGALEGVQGRSPWPTPASPSILPYVPSAAKNVGNDPTLTPQEKTTSWEANIPNYYKAAGEHVYGTPINIAKMQADSTLEPEWAATAPSYIGFTEEDRRAGWVPVLAVPKPGPDATPSDWERYQKELYASIRPPTYLEHANVDQFNKMDYDKVVEVQTMMRDAGKFKPTETLVPGIPGSAEQAIMYEWMARANRSGVKWEDIAKQDMATAAAARKDAAAQAAANGPLTQQTTINYNLTSMAQGRSVLGQVLMDALGRPPTQEELKQYIVLLNNAESKSPTKTITNYVREGSQMTSTSRETPTSVDPKQVAVQFAADLGGGKELMDHQTMSYLDRLMQYLIGAQRI